MTVYPSTMFFPDTQHFIRKLEIYKKLLSRETFFFNQTCIYLYMDIHIYKYTYHLSIRTSGPKTECETE